ACTGAIASKLTPTVKSIPNQIVIFFLIGAGLARDTGGAVYLDNRVIVHREQARLPQSIAVSDV
ncbi:hypothetical protein, partial [Pseudomonas syringae group sp. J309-1]|uniref:hypothetical protein n=1 Tax=Pseudomonas syringae group sp. J309-1 TaxID=3079588 RepID=UPI002910414C